MRNLPTFTSPFLYDVTKSFSKVRKSIKYDAYEVKFNKVMDLVDGRKSEKIEISIRSSASRSDVITRLYIWDDRWLWLDSRKSQKKGWEWEYNIEGRLSGLATEKNLMEALKAFYKESLFYNDDNIISQANTHWKKLIATGPIEVLGCEKGSESL